MNWSRWAWPVIIIASNIGIGLLVFGELLPPARYLMGFWFLLVCPGMAFVRLLHIRDDPVEFTLAIALSISLDAIVSTLMVYTGNWSPNTGLIALMTLSLVGATLQIAQIGLSKGTSSVRQDKAIEAK